ncbi:MAG: hypothetical protein LUE93_11000, partial [Bacteroides sp.]|nr:hypothetical protein [Bacteroides sp.]
GGLGFPVGSEVIGATKLEFDVTDFMPLLSGLGEGTSKFILTVKNDAGLETEKTLTVMIK